MARPPHPAVDPSQGSTSDNMPGGRLVNLFWRLDGRCIFDESWGPGELPAVPSPPPPAVATRGDRAMDTGMRVANRGRTSGNPMTASTVWSLVQVFVQFAREVDGGNIQRLVFRDAVLPVGKRRVFGTANGSAASSPRPIIIHVAHDALFVVTITESPPLGASEVHRTEGRDASILAFAHAVLRHVAAEQETFLKSVGAHEKDDGVISRPTAITSSARQLEPALRDAGDVVASASDTNHSATEFTRKYKNYGQTYKDVPSTADPDLQANYVSSSSTTSFASQSSESLSQGSSIGEGIHSTPPTPMMPIDNGQLARLVHRIRVLHDM